MIATIRILLCLLFAFAGQPAQAQTRLTVSQALDFWITVTESEVVPAADAMPEEKYSFAPSGNGFTGVRTFAQQVKHLAANNYRMAARIVGNRPTPKKCPKPGLTQSDPKPRSWTISRAHSQRCIGRWLPSTIRIWWSPSQTIPNRKTPVFNLLKTSWPTPTITMARWWNTCA